MTSPVAWLAIAIAAVATTTVFMTRPPPPTAPRSLPPTAPVVLAAEPVSSQRSWHQVATLLYDPATADDQLVAELDVLARVPPQSAPVVSTRLKIVLHDPGTVSYLASRLFGMRNATQIDTALAALETLSGLRNAAEFLSGYVTCKLDELSGADADAHDEDRDHFRQLSENLLGYCGEVALDDLPESVTEVGKPLLGEGRLRFEDPHAVRQLVLASPELRTSNVLLTLFRCGVRFPLEEVLLRGLALDVLQEMLPFVHDMQAGMQNQLAHLLREQRHEEVQEVFYDTRFRHEFAFHGDYSYLVRAFENAAHDERWIEARFLYNLPGNERWSQTPQVVELLKSSPANIVNAAPVITFTLLKTEPNST